MALKASPDDQALLLDLQALDTKLAQLDHRARSLPELATLAALTTEGDALRVARLEQQGHHEGHHCHRARNQQEQHQTARSMHAADFAQKPAAFFRRLA